MTDKEKNEVLLRFNPIFYTNQAIKQAVSDFSDVCDVTEAEDGIVLKPKEGDVEVIGYEFYNYVLGLMKNQ